MVRCMIITGCNCRRCRNARWPAHADRLRPPLLRPVYHYHGVDRDYRPYKNSSQIGSSPALLERRLVFYLGAGR